MSRDLIIFDPSGLAGFDGDGPEINEAINNFMSTNETATGDTTAAIQQFLEQAAGSYVGAYVGGAGRYCSINQPDAGGWENTIMIFSERVMKLGLLLLDPQGRNPVMSTPNGKGMMDF